MQTACSIQKQIFASPTHLSQLHFTDAAGNVNLLDKHMKP